MREVDTEGGGSQQNELCARVKLSKKEQVE